MVTAESQVYEYENRKRTCEVAARDSLERSRSATAARSHLGAGLAFELLILGAVLLHSWSAAPYLGQSVNLFSGASCFSAGLVIAGVEIRSRWTWWRMSREYNNLIQSNLTVEHTSVPHIPQQGR